MHGARRLRPFCPPNVPSWVLSIVLEGLIGPLYDTMELASEKVLTFKGGGFDDLSSTLVTCRLYQ